MWVKICGNTRLEDARLAAELGADALGFIFAPGSRRLVSAETAHAICNSIREEYPQVARIGVFTQPEPLQIAAMASQAGLTGVQLHGDAAQAAAGELRTLLPGVALIAAFAWSSAEDLLRRAQGGWDMLLVDAPSAKHLGGTGESFRWSDAREAFSQAAAQGVRVVAAGGLTPENVREAITELSPFGVDVATGVEQSPGVKDPAKLREFLRQARSERSRSFYF